MSQFREPIFLGSEFDQPKESHALFHVIPVPYEATVSYGQGTKRGPGAIIDASLQLEVFDGTSSPAEECIYTHNDVDCSGTREEIFSRITKAVARPLKADGDKVPVILGGEHSITYPVMQAMVEKYGPDNIGVVQFDAHADLRDRYEGSPYSHASVMRRIHDDLGVAIYQLGIRALCPEEFMYRLERRIPGVDAKVLVPSAMKEILLPESFPEHVFITFDVDALDPSIMPATGTPVPGGLSWYQSLNLLESVAAQRKVVGFDVVELAPMDNFVAPSFAAADLTYKIMGIIARSRLATGPQEHKN
ncbi:agmatinase [Spirochaeta lutea]|uniref:Agmatinase n=1 Tax=Spirochaeta lutea TaxID=1480694 RepID=A0A098QV47_9SPIO|nr:agmatinase [Spirochaeta lutea]KGE71436.1 agmatinase [Spirochaeta lutea]